jgi:hypothetical protein
MKLSAAYVGIFLATAIVGASGAANAATCPAPIGQADGCIQINLNPDGTVTVLNPGQGGNPGTTAVYDGVEDTLISVTNNSGNSVGSIHLMSNLGIFDFDGDGISTFLSAPTGPTGYEGPGTSFIFTSLTSGDVLFTGGLANGASLYFSLEQAITAADFGSIVVGPSVPGPIVGAGLLGLIAACGALLALARRRR